MIRINKTAFFLILILLGVCCLCCSIVGLIFYFREPIDQTIRKYYDFNLQAGEFQCSEYPTFSEIIKVNNNNSLEYKRVMEYIKENERYINLQVVSVDEEKPRCEGKYQFVINYNGSPELTPINSIISDNKIGNVPVVLRQN